MAKPKEKHFKYRLKCKLPSCNKPFGTNRDWQEFHHPDCQKEWQRLLKKTNKDVIVEIATANEQILNMKKRIAAIEEKLGIK